MKNPYVKELDEVAYIHYIRFICNNIIVQSARIETVIHTGVLEIIACS